jgi:transcriptional regulator with XRE-family HTH domain
MTLLAKTTGRKVGRPKTVIAVDVANKLMELGRAIKAAQPKLKQAKIAADLQSGTTQATISRILSGQHRPSYSDLIKLCELAEEKFEDYEFCALPGSKPQSPSVTTSPTREEIGNAARRTLELLLEYMEWFHSDQIFKRKVEFTVIQDGRQEVKTTDILMSATVTSRAPLIVLEQWGSPKPSVLPDSRSSVHIKALLEAERKVTNGTTFTPSKLEQENSTCTIIGGLSDYFSMLITHNQAEDQVRNGLVALATSPDPCKEFGNLKFDKYDALHNSNRLEKSQYAALGITTMLCYLDLDGQLKLVTRQRSNKVATHQGLHSPVPAGIFQPDTKEHALEWNLQYQVVKEYCEELFDCKPDETYTHPSYIFNTWPEAQELQTMLFDGRCKLLHAGIVQSLLNFHYEICCVLLFENDDWIKGPGSKMKVGWEDINPGKAGVGARPDMKLSNIDQEFYDHAELRHAETYNPGVSIPAKWTPTGLAAFWLGVAAINEHKSKPAARPNQADRSTDSYFNKLLGLK